MDYFYKVVNKIQKLFMFCSELFCSTLCSRLCWFCYIIFITFPIYVVSLVSGPFSGFPQNRYSLVFLKTDFTHDFFHLGLLRLNLTPNNSYFHSHECIPLLIVINLYSKKPIIMTSYFYIIWCDQFFGCVKLFL